RDLRRALAAAGAPFTYCDAAADVQPPSLIPRRHGLRLAVACGVERRLQRLPRADVLEALAPRRLLAVHDQVLQAEVGRVHTDAPRDLVNVRFDRPDALRLARRPHEATGNEVGVNKRRVDAAVGDAVRPGRLIRAADAAVRLERRVGAGVDEVVDLVRGDRAVARHAA